MWWKFSFDHDKEPWYMWCTYGMSGQWNTEESKHSSFKVNYNEYSQKYFQPFTLWFNDIRHFGTIKFIKGTQRHEKKLLTLGPCILSSGLTLKTFKERLLKHCDKRIAEVLLDQSVVSGIGNYLRAEILYASKIDPWRKIESLKEEEIFNLSANILSISKRSYDSQGASISTYKNVDGLKGTTQFNFKVYSKKTDPLGNRIIQEVDLNGRMVHWCPAVQK